MKTIGALIKSTREAQNMSIRDLSRETKIKVEFLEALEKESWSKLPELPVTIGFVKNVADALSISREQAVAFLRRDYPPKVLSMLPRERVKSAFKWGPKYSFLVVAGVLLLILGSYLVYQFTSFSSPPRLTVISPTNEEVVSSKNVTVRGVTEDTSTVRVNSQPVVVESDGTFTTEVEVVPQTKEVTITATSRSGKETTVKRTIQVIQK